MRFLIGPWPWLVLVYLYLALDDLVVVVSVEDGRTAVSQGRGAARPTAATEVRVPRIRALGRMSTPSRFCSSTCADQPAVREHANIAGARSGGTWATSSTIADQNSTFGHEWSGMLLRDRLVRDALELLGDLDARRAELLRRPLQQPRARVLGAVHAMPEAHDPLVPRPSASLTHFSASPISATASSIGSTRAGAPPCSGPESAPTAADSAAPQSAPVDATVRAVNVDAFMPCSAVQIQYVSIACACRSSTSPRHASRKRSAAVRPASTVSSGTGGRSAPRAGLRDDRERRGRQPAEILLRVLVVDVDELAELPPAAEDGEHRLEVGHVAAGPHLELAVGRREARLERAVDEQPPHLLEGDAADELLDVDAAIAERSALAVGLGDLRLDRDDAGQAGREVVHA